MLKKYIIIAILALSSCTTLNSALVTKDSINKEGLKRGKTCSKNIFGGFKLPYFGDTTIKLSGSQSIMVAIDKAGITKPVIIDRYKKHYIFYTELCTIIFGE